MRYAEGREGDREGGREREKLTDTKRGQSEKGRAGERD